MLTNNDIIIIVLNNILNILSFTKYYMFCHNYKNNNFENMFMSLYWSENFDRVNVDITYYSLYNLPCAPGLLQRSGASRAWRAREVDIIQQKVYNTATKLWIDVDMKHKNKFVHLNI